MSIDQSAILAAGVALVVAVAGIVAWATASAARSRPDPTSDARPAELLPPNRDERSGPASGVRRAVPALVAPVSGRQVARIVAFLFLASAAMVVAITRAWAENEAAIFALIATGLLLVVLFMDMLPSSALGRWRHPVEGLGAVLLLGLLMALTGGIGSPFVVGFYLVVAGTALSAEGIGPLLVAAAAALTVAVVAVVTNGPSLDAAGLAWIGVNAVGLVLVADLSAAAARAQRVARDEALRVSRFDSLTGLFNRAFFATVMEQEIRRSERMDRTFALLMLDLDDLKPVNDTFGHQWGDRLIKAVADQLRQTIRFTDSAARYGGDEFIVLLPETDAAGAYVVAETLRRDIAALTLRASDRNVRSSVSVGLVTYPEDGTTSEQLIAAADVAMYESKRRGKNQIVGYRTRGDRVATPIDIAAGELVSPGPPSARMGGDAAPWAPTPRTGGPGSRDEPAPSRGGRQHPASVPDLLGQTGEPSEGERQPNGSNPAALPRASNRGRSENEAAAGEELPAWATRPQGPAPDLARAREGDTAVGDQAGAAADPPGAAPDAPTQRRGSSREKSRADEIRRARDREAQRPWIALPIDQPAEGEPPETPGPTER